MAGGLTISTLNDSSGVLATQNGMSGICKGWVNFTGSTAAIKASFNVSSVTRASTGVYTVTFTTALPDANYSAQVSAGNLADINGGLTSTAITNMRVFNDAGSSTDPTNVCVAVFR